MYFPGKQKIAWIKLWEEGGGMGNGGSRLDRLGAGGRLDLRVITEML